MTTPLYGMDKIKKDRGSGIMKSSPYLEKAGLKNSREALVMVAQDQALSPNIEESTNRTQVGDCAKVTQRLSNTEYNDVRCKLGLYTVRGTTKWLGLSTGPSVHHIHLKSPSPKRRHH